MMPPLAILVLLQLCGEILARLLGLPLPGGLVGMLLLLVGLIIHGEVGSDMQRTSQALLQNLMLLFIPFIAGVMAQLEQLKSQWLPFLATCVLGALVSLIATAWTLRWMLALQQRRRHGAD